MAEVSHTIHSMLSELRVEFAQFSEEFASRLDSVGCRLEAIKRSQDSCTRLLIANRLRAERMMGSDFSRVVGEWMQEGEAQR